MLDLTVAKQAAQHNKVVVLVDEMIAAKKELAKLNLFFGTKLTRLGGPDELTEPDVEAVTRSLSGSDLRLLRNHPKVQFKPEPDSDFVVTRGGDITSAEDLFTGKSEEPMYALPVSGKGRRKTHVVAPKEILAYLKRVLPRYSGKPWDEVRNIPLARDLATYRAREKEVVSDARRLLRNVAGLQDRIDEIVYKLYGLSESDIAEVERSQDKRPG
jgi:hypothetical protein